MLLKSVSFRTIQDKPTKNLDEACWLVYEVQDAQGILAIGRNNHNYVPQALSFASDLLRFKAFSHPATNLAKGILVPARLVGERHAEQAAFLKQGDNWYFADFNDLGGSYEIVPVRAFDPVPHLDKITEKAKRLGWTTQRQSIEVEMERNRAGFEANFPAKWGWARFFNEPLSIAVWIAHVRKLGMHYFKMGNEPDDEKALKMKDDHIADKIEWERYLKPITVKAREMVKQYKPADIDTDAPDFEPRSEVDKVPSVPLDAVMPFVGKNGTPQGFSVDLGKLNHTVSLQLYRFERGKAHDTGRAFTWDISDDFLRAKVTVAASEGCGVNFKTEFVPECKVG